MALSNDIISQFAKLTATDKPKNSEKTVYGTIVERDGSKYVKLDGSDLLTPVASTTNIEPDERVTVMIKNHTATITGNLSSPAARSSEVSEIGSQISVFETIIADKVDTIQLVAVEAQIEDLEAKNVVIEDTLIAAQASIKELETTKLSAETADIKYANIDFTNIGKAAMEYFYAESGLIRNVVVDNQTITGNLVGVTISGDLIEGNTVVAEKLVIKGEDGLYYKLNTDGMNVETQQTDYNSLNGSVIKAKSITATKISVSDLVAFDATIGGFNITEDSIHSGVKESVDNTTEGIYLDKTGQMALGDSNNFIKYYKDANGLYKLSISADEFYFSTNGKSITESILDASGQQMTLSFEQGNAIEAERRELTITVQVWKNDEDITSQIPAKSFSWQRESGNDAADAEWNALASHRGVTSIVMTREEIGKSCQIRCTLSEADSMGYFTIQDGELVLTVPDGTPTDEFHLQNGDLYGLDYYVLEDGSVKRHVAGDAMSVTTSVFDHSILETSHILVQDDVIDIHAGGTLNLESGSNINMQAGSNMSVGAGSSIAMNAGSNIELQAESDISVEAGGSVNLKSGSAMNVVGAEVNVKSSGKINLDSGSEMNIKAGSAFTVESGNFDIDAEGNVTMNGTVTAEAGKIGGWDIESGAFSSGRDNNHVSISPTEGAPAIWTGAEASENAPFRVGKDGSVYLTRLYVTDENGVAQSTPVNLHTSYWKMDKAYSRAVKSMTVEGNTLTITLYDGTTVNFKKAATGSLVASGNGSDNFTVAYIQDYSGPGTGTTVGSGNVKMEMDSDTYSSTSSVIATFDGATYGRLSVGDVYDAGYSSGNGVGYNAGFAAGKEAYQPTVISRTGYSTSDKTVTVRAANSHQDLLTGQVIDASEIYNAGYSSGNGVGYNTGFAAGKESYLPTVISRTGYSTANKTVTVKAANSHQDLLTGKVIDASEIYTAGYAAGWAAAKAKIALSGNQITGPSATVDSSETLYTVTAGGNINLIQNTAANYFRAAGYGRAYVNGSQVDYASLSYAQQINVGQ